MDIRRIDICGVPVDLVDRDRARARVAEMLRLGRRGAIFAVNPEKVMHANRDERLRRVLADAALLIPDGIGVVLAARLLRRGAVARVPGCELMPALCAQAAADGRSVFLFGGAAGIAESAAAALRRDLPNLRVAGCEHGFHPPGESERIIDRINSARPDFLFVALGSPRQEFWIAEHLDRLEVGICQAVGGTFDVLAGVAKRAPKAFRALQLEWLYRLLSDPRRAGRQAALPLFAARVVREHVLGLAPGNRPERA